MASNHPKAGNGFSLPTKRIISIILSVIIAFGTFVTLTVGSFTLSDWIDFKSYITANASTNSNLRVYRYDNLVGIYNLDYTDETTIQYKIGDNGEWQDYVRPFYIEPYQTTKIYKRLGTSGSANYSSLTVDTLAMGKYTQSFTDFEIRNHNASFAYARTYNSKNNSWFESVDSRVYLYSAGLARIYLPDGTMLNLPRTEENKYVDEITGNTLVKDTESGFYIYEQDSYTYKFKITDSETTYYLNKVCDKNSNTVTITRRSSGITVSDGNSRSFVAPYITASNSADTMHTYTGSDVNGNIFTYTAKDSVFYQVKNQDGVVIDDYSYSTCADGVERLTSTADLTIEYYNNGRLKKVTGLDGSYTSFGYNNAKNKLRVTKSGQGSSYTVYDKAFLPVSYTDESGNELEYEYYSNYKLKKEITDGQTTSYKYANGKISSAITTDNEDSSVISKTVYANGLPVMELEDDYYTYYTYDSRDNMLISADLKEDYTGTPPQAYDETLDCFDVTSYIYDSKGRVTREALSNGESSEYTYDSRGNVLTKTDNEYEDDEATELTSTVTTYTYDNLDNILTTATEDDNCSYLYDNVGRLILSNENGSYTRSVYDEKGRIVQQIGPDDYNSADDDLDNNTYSNENVGTRYFYNDSDQLVKEINNINVTTDYTYFDTGETKTEKFDIYEIEYNIAGNPVDIWVNKAKSTVPYAHYVYENDGNQLLPTGNESSANGAEDESSGTFSMGGIVGKNTQIQYGNGQIILLDYDDQGNVTQQSFKESSSAAENVQFKYSYNSEQVRTQKIDFVNNLVYAYSDDSTSVYTLAYDESNQPVAGNLISSQSKSYTDDDDETEDVYEGASTQVSTVNSADITSVFAVDDETYTTSNGSFTLTTTDNDNGYVTQLKDSNGNVIYSYDCNDSSDDSASLAISAGSYSKTLEYTYDNKGRITSYGSSADDIEYYHYDSKGQLVRADIRHGSDVSAGSTTRYFYDSRGNITREKNYSYSTTDDLRNNKPEEDGVFDFDYENSVWVDGIETVSGDEQVVYDENGNPISIDDLIFNWTNGRSLSSLQYEDENGQLQTLLSYKYDENGIRVSKTYGDVTTYYVTDNGYITAQYQLDESGNICELMRFIYDSANTLLGFTYNGQTYFYLKNLQGDITNIVDTAGNIVGTYEYSAFGECYVDYSADNDIAYTNPMRYRDYYLDDEMSWYYLQSRYYVPTWGRFLNSDLPKYAQEQKDSYVGLNLFAYCCNNPINKSDPNGNGSNIYVFYYYCEGSEHNLYSIAKNAIYYNYYSSNVIAFCITNFIDFVTSWNSMNNADKVYLFLHGGKGKLYFKDGKITADKIYKACNFVHVDTRVYLFSCHGGSGKKENNVANVMAKLSENEVYALPTGVSYGFSALQKRYAKVRKKYYFLKGKNYSWNKFTATYVVKKKKRYWKYSSVNLNIKDIWN